MDESSFADGKKIELITSALRLLYQKQENLDKQISDTRGIFVSSVLSAVLTIPLYNIINSKINSVLESILFLIIIIPVLYLILWFFFGKILPPIFQFMEGRKPENGNIDYRDVVERFNKTIINRVLILDGMRSRYETAGNKLSEEVKCLYKYEILDDWAYIVRFIRCRIFVSNETFAEIVRTNTQNKGIDNINSTINICSLFYVVQILFSIGNFLSKNIDCFIAKEGKNLDSSGDIKLIMDDLNVIQDKIEKK